MRGPIRAVGGPLDGALVKHGERMGRFAWINERGTTKAAPGRNRWLYRAEMWESEDGHRVTWVYAGNRWFRCGSCGAFHRRVEGGAERPECHLCGSPP